LRAQDRVQWLAEDRVQWLATDRVQLRAVVNTGMNLWPL
jgi:hypothetical protein